MVLITKKEIKEIKELLPYLEDRDKKLIEKLINSYECSDRRYQELRKQKLINKEEK